MYIDVHVLERFCRKCKLFSIANNYVKNHKTIFHITEKFRDLETVITMLHKKTAPGELKCTGDAVLTERDVVSDCMRRRTSEVLLYRFSSR